MSPDAAIRTSALIRHNTILLLRDPGALASRLILPLAFLVLLHPLYEAAQGQRGGVIQAVIATLVTFSLLALSIVGGSIITDRIWHTWERVRVTAARPLEVITGKAVPVLAALLAWTLALLSLGAMLGVLARSVSELSAAYDIGAMILSSLGEALVPLAALPSWVRHVAPASPGYWAVSSLEAALRGDAARTLATSGVLLGFAVGAGLITMIRASRGWGRSARM